MKPTNDKKSLQVVGGGTSDDNLILNFDILSG